MKYLKSYESLKDDLPDNIKLVDVMWNGFYKTFNNDIAPLTVGDYTDKGTIVNRRVYNSDVYFTTEEGEFRANQFSVYTSDNYWTLRDFIELKNDTQKFNL